MYGGKTLSRIFHAPDTWRERLSSGTVHACLERNGSAQNGSKRSCKREAYPYLCGTVPYRTVPKSCVNAVLHWNRTEPKKVRIAAPNGTVPKLVRMGLAFTLEPLELFHLEPLSVPFWVL